MLLEKIASRMYIDFSIDVQEKSAKESNKDDDLDSIMYIEFSLTEFNKSVIGYVARFVPRKILKSINCNKCRLVLLCKVFFFY